ncbi:hypothetical protein B7494_g8071 [Chlorociboria aeruginascens]|nr:hypothetical protein B7494_g8071 [Chlorociboria aeruginascens]
MMDSPIPIAVVGMGCRFPGGAHDPGQLWKLVVEGRDAWSDAPAGRYNWESFNHPHYDAQGMHNHRGGHFIDEDIAAFDSMFFGIAPLEAKAIDPQQRLLLHTAYEALENAGIPIESIRGSNTGVFVATFTHDYEQIVQKDLLSIPKYFLTGVGSAIFANRISYLFDLKGPSWTVDTACSGSLVAIHQACQSLRSGESNMALAGGTSLMLSPDLMMGMSLLQILNSDGKSYAFDTRGSGYGRGEGVATLVLKRLDDAIRDGDNVHAIIRNTGVNQDGKTSGITVPSGLAQESLMRSVYNKAGLDPKDTLFFEAHGTGTVTGDITEVGAIGNLFFESDPASRDMPLYLGSIKANIGHTEGVSGIAGLLKAILVLQNRTIPPVANVNVLKEGMIRPGWNMEVPKKAIPWPEGKLRRASVNSFGYGGTNAHAIVEVPESATTFFESHSSVVSIDHRTNGRNSTTITGSINGHTNGTAKTVPTEQEFHVIPFTARSEVSLKLAVERFRDWLKNHEGELPELGDIIYTLVSRRSMFPWRYTVVATTSKDLVKVLDNPLKSFDRVVGTKRLIFTFTGQGAQWYSMGRELIFTSAVFRNSVQKSTQILQDLGAPWDLIEELLREKAASKLNQSEIGQPASTAIQLALIDLLKDLGVLPDAVVGHSSGEIAAAYAIKVLSQESAMRVSYYRGFLSKRSTTFIATKGGMLAVGLGEHDLPQYMSKVKSGKIVIACANSPSSTTISGDDDGISELKAILDKSSIFVRSLQVDTAYHSHHMEAVAQSYLADLEGLIENVPSSSIEFISTVTGKKKTTDFGAEYWVKNLVSKVRFYEALENAVPKERTSSLTHTLLEIGPHHALAGPTRDTMLWLGLTSSQFACLPSLVRDKSSVQTILDSVGKLFQKGFSVNLPLTNSLDGKPTKGAVVGSLPPYSWDLTNRYWHESRFSKEHRLRPNPYHELLGIQTIGTPLSEPSWRHIIGIDSLPWLQHHVVDGVAVFPATAYLAMAIEAKKQIAQILHPGGVILNYVLKDVAFSKALIIPESPGTVELFISLKSSKGASEKALGSWEQFQVSSISEGLKWNEHAHGYIMVELQEHLDPYREQEDCLAAISQRKRIDALRFSTAESVTEEKLYEDLKTMGNHYGPTFALVREYNRSKNNAYGTVIIPEIAELMPAKSMQPYVIHPGTLDAITHTCLPLFAGLSKANSVFTVGMRDVTISAKLTDNPGEILEFTTNIVLNSPSSALIDISVFQDNAEGGKDLVLRLVDGELRGLSDKLNASESGARNGSIYELKWDLDLDIADPHVIKFENQDRSDVAEASGRKIDILNKASALFVRSTIPGISDSSVDGSQSEYFRWLKRFNDSQLIQDILKQLSQPEAENILKVVATTGVEGESLDRIGRNLKRILTAEVDPLTLMMEDNLLSRGYTDEAVTRCYAHLIKFVKHLIFKNPRLKVLEMGAGTGGCTFPLLEGLENNGDLPFESYDFTDISPGFFEVAASKMRQWIPTVNFKVLDLAKNPLKQGFVEGSYDVVIAANAIHVTNNLDEGIEFARSLLKPGGWLLLVENTQVHPFLNTICGITPGWYCGINDDRKDSPTISREQWDTRLLRGGFNGVAYSANDCEGSNQRYSFMAARSVQPDISTSLPVHITTSPGCSVEHSKFAQQLSQHFSHNQFQATVSVLGGIKIDKNILYVVLDDMESPLLLDPSLPSFATINQTLMKANNILWVCVAHKESSREDSNNGITAGYLRSAREENDDLKIVTFTMQDGTVSMTPDLPEKIINVASESFYRQGSLKSLEHEFAYSKGQIKIPRLVPNEIVQTLVNDTMIEREPEEGLVHQIDRPLILHVEKPGLLDSLRFVDDVAHRNPLLPHQVDIKVKAFGMNFKDLIIALGQMKAGVPMAGEVAGVVTAIGSDFKNQLKIGDRVCGWAGSEYASQTRMHALNTCKLPDNMTFEVGASIPTVFCTAWTGLVEIAHLQPGQSVLIHAGAGGVGQAAIKIAQRIGAEIFATVGSPPKRAFLMEHFGIPEDHIFSSRNVTFKKGVMRMTKGVGVHVVLNSLSGEILRESLACVGRFGYFIEIGKVDMYSKASISLEVFDKSITLAAIDLYLLSLYRPAYSHMVMGKVMELFVTGQLTPVSPITVMPLTQMEDAFRFLQAGKHMGKIVLSANDDTIVNILPPPPPMAQLNAQGTYIVSGGTGGLGLEIGRWLTTRGAKYIVLLSRSTLSPAAKSELEEEFMALGATVYSIPIDIADPESCKNLASIGLKDAPPVKGIFQGAAVTRDTMIESMQLEEYNAVLRPKVCGTQNLLKAFDTPTLEFFVMLSSTASILGARGSANYAAGNSFLDAVATMKTKGHAHIITINLGPMKETGIVARDSRLERLFQLRGLIALRNKELFALLDYAVSPKAREDHCRQIVTGFNRASISTAGNISALNNPLLNLLPVIKDKAISSGSGLARSLQASVENSADEEEARRLITEHLTKKISTLAAVDIDIISEDIALDSLGMDSLVVIELKNWISRSLQVTLQPSEILEASNIPILTGKIVDRTPLIRKRIENGEADPKMAKAEPARIVPEVKNDSSKTQKANGFTKTNETNRVNEAKETKTSNDTKLVPNNPTLQKQPIPPMHIMLENFLEAASCIASPIELIETQKKVQDFKESNSPGQILHNRLVKHACNPEVDNWFTDILVHRVFLGNRKSMVPFQNYFGSHPVQPGVQPNVAERAATLTIAAFRCKTALKAGKVSADMLREKTLDMNSYNGLFNVVREPQVGQDRLQAYRDYDHIVVFKCGQPFKIDLQGATFVSLKRTFEAIITLGEGQKSWIPALTIDERNSWAEGRNHLKALSPKNRNSLAAIETATFIICLDDSKPETQTERSYGIFWGDGSNRWHDKSLQFVVFENGASGTVCEHALLDGTSTNPLKAFIVQAFQEEQQYITSRRTDETTQPVEIEQLDFVTDIVIDSQINMIRNDFQARVEKYTFSGFQISTLSEKILRQAKVAPKAGVQLAIQLASFRFFGYFPSSVETVSLTHYRHGRSAVTQTLWPTVANFCQSYDDIATSQQEKKTLFLTAAATLTTKLSRAASGGAFFRYMLALQSLQEEGDSVPALFEDQVYKRSQRPVLTTDCLESDLYECGIVLEPPGSVWIHFQARDDSVIFAIWGHDANTKEFQKELEIAIDDVRRLL